MINITTGQLEFWVAQYFWPFARIAACLMVAPVFGAQFIPARFKIALAGAITLLVAPMFPPPEGVIPLSVAGAIVTIHQLLIGFATGFILQVIFDSLAMGGQLLANSMGLSFAFNVDPQHGASTPVVGQLYMLLVILTFLALNGHLAMLETLVQGFRGMPIGMSSFNSDELWMVVMWGRQLFDGALAVALPGMTALLIVNLGFGVMSRAAPALNMFAVGFPIVLVFGMAIMLLGLPAVQSSFTQLFGDSMALIRTLSRGD
ncbi:MAG: flagellar biosynthetic protein FliR [Candidatus Obscuribacterales bacterium]|nr:flagellar biosynthetic protein FliR [Steroidobacteraceae bacterium]